MRFTYLIQYYFCVGLLTTLYSGHLIAQSAGLLRDDQNEQVQGDEETTEVSHGVWERVGDAAYTGATAACISLGVVGSVVVVMHFAKPTVNHYARLLTTTFDQLCDAFSDTVETVHDQYTHGLQQTEQRVVTIVNKAQDKVSSLPAETITKTAHCVTKPVKYVFTATSSTAHSVAQNVSAEYKQHQEDLKAVGGYTGTWNFIKERVTRWRHGKIVPKQKVD